MSHRLILATAVLAYSSCNLFSPTASDERTDVFMSEDVASVADVSTGEDASVPNDIGEVLPTLDMQASDSGSSDMTAVSPDTTTVDSAQDFATPDVGAPDLPNSDPCDWADTVFCSGFEDATFSDWSQGLTTSDGAAIHTTVRSHGGTGSMQIDTFAGDARVAATTTIAAGLGDNDEFWIRAFIYLPSQANLDSFEWVGVSNALTDEEANAQIGSDFVDGHFHLDSYSGYPSSGFVFPRDRWVCMEWNIQTSASNGTSVVAVDGVTEVFENGLDLDPIQPLDRFDIGVVWSDDTQDPFTVWFDDVFVGRSRPGCD